MKSRSGVTLTELLVAATVVITGMAIVTPLAVRSGRMWMQTREQHLALDELSNQLERLLRLPGEELTSEIEMVSASDLVLGRLPEVKLNAELLSDSSEEDTTQRCVRVSINWKRKGDPAPIQLVGWVDASKEQTDVVEQTE